MWLLYTSVPALLKYTRTVYYIDNLEIARLTPDSIEFFNIDKEPDVYKRQLYDYICAIELVPSEEESYDLCLQCQRLFNGSGDEIGLWA